MNKIPERLLDAVRRCRHSRILADMKEPDYVCLRDDATNPRAIAPPCDLLHGVCVHHEPFPENHND